MFCFLKVSFHFNMVLSEGGRQLIIRKKTLLFSRMAITA